MALINVRRDVSDAFYRYKMEKVQTKIEGKGNGIKTVIINLSSIAQSLSRPGAYVIKYFGFELGAQTNIDPRDDRWIINGSHDAPKLQDYLDGFINKFVLCKKCKNPETDVVVKDDRITLDCKACGARSDVDIRLKLSGFILKNQPKKAGKKDKAERKALRHAKQNGNGKKNGSGSGAEDNSDASAEKEKDKGAADDAGSDHEFEKVKADAYEAAVEAGNKEDDWAVDMSEAAVKARMAQLPGDFKQKVTIEGEGDEDDEGEGGGNSVYDQLGTWIQEQADASGGADGVESIDIYKKAKELSIEGKHRTILVLVQTIFDVDKICAQIPKRASMLKSIITSERHEKALLGGTERFVGINGKEKPELYSQVVKILQLYYHFDLINEDVATKWGAKASKKYVDLATSKKVRKAAEPFLTWLAEAESEEDEDEDDE